MFDWMTLHGRYDAHINAKGDLLAPQAMYVEIPAEEAMVDGVCVAAISTGFAMVRECAEHDVLRITFQPTWHQSIGGASVEFRESVDGKFRVNGEEFNDFLSLLINVRYRFEGIK